MFKYPFLSGGIIRGTESFNPTTGNRMNGTETQGKYMNDAVATSLILPNSRHFEI